MARLFDEVADYLTVADHSALTLPNADWSIGIWVKLTDNTGALYQYFLSWGAVEDTPSLNWFFLEEDAVGDGGKLRVYLNNGAINFQTSGTPGTSTAWQHLALVRSGTTLTQYVNGSADGSGALSAAVDVGSTLYLGRREDGDIGRWFGGRLAELAKWDRALSAGELSALAGGLPPTRIGGQLKLYIPILGISDPEPNYAGTGVGAVLVSAPPTADHVPLAPPFAFGFFPLPKPSAAAAGQKAVGITDITITFST